MSITLRFSGNPILTPNLKHDWESRGSFNGCPIIGDDGCHLVYRAQSSPMTICNKRLELSTIGHAISYDRVSYLNRRQLISPTEPWEQFGCEDPRITRIGTTYYICYTSIATWPPTPEGISVALATTEDFFTLTGKYHCTPFNSKAMTLFPEKINGKYAAVLTVNCDLPPSTIAIAYANQISDLWNNDFWSSWHKTYAKHAIPLLRTTHDHVEIGAPPIRIPQGWLLIYSYIKSYNTTHKFFSVEAALLDEKDPTIILKRTTQPLLFPETEYEQNGNIPNIVFPSGAIMYNDTIGIYYGASDTSTCLATCPLQDVLTSMR